MHKTSDGLEILKRIAGDAEETRFALAQGWVASDVAGLIYNAREAVGLTQKQLADLTGTKQSVIARLEDSDYRGHSLTMLTRIAFALGYEVDVQLIPPRYPDHISKQATAATSIVLPVQKSTPASGRRSVAAAEARGSRSSVKRSSVKRSVGKVAGRGTGRARKSR